MPNIVCNSTQEPVFRLANNLYGLVSNCFDFETAETGT